MNNEQMDILIFTDGTLQMRSQESVLVDDHGEAWLTPDQVDRLEAAEAYFSNIIYADSHTDIMLDMEEYSAQQAEPEVRLPAPRVYSSAYVGAFGPVFV